MNDLELRAALHHDADLVGEPSPDLLDQLVDRRRRQRRSRAGMLTVAAAVIVIAAGIPIGSSFLTRSDGGPATQTPSPTGEAPPDVPPTDPAPASDLPIAFPPSPAAGWPPEAGATHGGQYWAVYLAVARSADDKDELEQAEAGAAAVGYQAGIGDLCADGVHEQLGLDRSVDYQSVDLYFDTREQAQQFVDLYEPGVVGTALITAYCLD